MPIVRIDIQTGKSTAYKRDILRSVRTALTRSLSVPEDRIIARVIETPAENIDAPEIRSDRLTVIEVSMLPRQTPAAKQSLYADIVSELGERLGIHQHDISLVVTEPTAECFAIGGVMQCTLPGDESTPAEEEEEITLVPETTVVPIEPNATQDDEQPLATGAEA